MSLAPDDPRHGTTNGYSNLDCRCGPCCRAHSVDHQRENRERRARLGDPRFVQPTHGKQTTYSNWMCRCEPCTEAARIVNARYRHPTAVSL